MGNDYVIMGDDISRQHFKIVYDETHGWMLREYFDTKEKLTPSGTWVHPKTYTLSKYARSQSEPVAMYDGMLIKCYSFLFKFTISK